MKHETAILYIWRFYQENVFSLQLKLITNEGTIASTEWEIPIPISKSNCKQQPSLERCLNDICFSLSLLQKIHHVTFRAWCEKTDGENRNMHCKMSKKSLIKEPLTVTSDSYVELGSCLHLTAKVCRSEMPGHERFVALRIWNRFWNFFGQTFINSSHCNFTIVSFWKDAKWIFNFFHWLAVLS